MNSKRKRKLKPKGSNRCSIKGGMNKNVENQLCGGTCRIHI